MLCFSSCFSVFVVIHFVQLIFASLPPTQEEERIDIMNSFKCH